MSAPYDREKALAAVRAGIVGPWYSSLAAMRGLEWAGELDEAQLKYADRVAAYLVAQTTLFEADDAGESTDEMREAVTTTWRKLERCRLGGMSSGEWHEWAMLL